MQEIELEEINIILRIPKESVKLRVIAFIPDENDDTKLTKVQTNISPSELREMRKNFLDNLIDDDYDARYVLTEKGEECLGACREGEEYL